MLKVPSLPSHSFPDTESDNINSYGPNGKIRFTFNLIEWASRPEVQKAWNELAVQYGIKHNPFDDLERVWTPTNFALIGSWPNSVR